MSGKKLIFDSELFDAGVQYHCRCEEDGLVLQCSSKTAEEDVAVYFTPPIDGGEKDTLWSRVVIYREKAMQGTLRVCCFASNQYEIESENRNMVTYLEDFQVPLEEKVMFFENSAQYCAENTTDLFLTGLKGRYLWLKIEYHSFHMEGSFLSGLQIEYHVKNIVEYLPFCYRQEDSFVQRFLGIFQSILYDFQEQIESVTAYLDPDSVDLENLEWLCKWASCICLSSWNDEKIRQFIKRSFSFYQQKGTKEGIKNLVAFCTGKEPFLFELWEIMECCGKSFYTNGLQKLYGENQHSFWVLIEEDALYESDVQEIEEVINRYKPIHTKACIGVLKRKIVLGGHTYLGINSEISGTSDFIIGGDGTNNSFYPTRLQ